MFLSKSKFGICNRFRFLLLPFVALTSQEAFNFEKLCWKKKTKQYKMWVYWVCLKSFLFPLGVSFRPLIKAVPGANLTFLGSLHFLIYLRSLFKLPICEMWRLENGPFSKWEVLFPRTNLAANKDKILV